MDSKDSLAQSVSASQRLTRNSIWNLAGQVAPMFIALITIPFLIKNMGTERFGVLTLVWVAVGYFGLLDFGLGRAIIQIVAKHRVHESKKSTALIDNQVHSALWLLFGIGLVGSACNWLIAPTLIQSVLNVPASLKTETLTAFFLISIALPIVILTSGLSGVLEGLHRFDIVNRIRIPVSVGIYLLPALLSFYHNELEWIVATVILSRGLGFIFYLLAVYKHYPAVLRGKFLPWADLKPILSFSGWMTVSNVVSPVMVNMDRFFIGSFLTLTMVSYYTTPFEMVSKILVIPAAIGGVLFAALSESLHRDSMNAKRLFLRGQKTILLLTLPVVLIFLFGAHPILSLWVGPEFSENSTVVFQVLTFCMFLNSLGQMPVAYLQGLGRPDLVAKLHLLELPIYVACLYFGVKLFGITGAAAAWLIRATIDTSLLNGMVYSYLRKSNGKSP
jgi:O-antigen/teichoic acid export membrane protein